MNNNACSSPRRPPLHQPCKKETSFILTQFLASTRRSNRALLDKWYYCPFAKWYSLSMHLFVSANTYRAILRVVLTVEYEAIHFLGESIAEQCSTCCCCSHDLRTIVLAKGYERGELSVRASITSISCSCVWGLWRRCWRKLNTPSVGASSTCVRHAVVGALPVCPNVRNCVM